MCAILGFLNYKNKVSNRKLRKLIKHLSIAAEVRGVDATGISYVKDGSINTFKKAKPAHKVKLKFPKGTNAVIGHTRHTTQGNQKLNFNNHPFNGKCDNGKFALAHNGVLWNDKELRATEKLPHTHIETDSYVAVQLIEKKGKLDYDSLKYMAENIEGSFMITTLRDDNTLFLVKGDNPIALYHFYELGLYVYASTKEILEKGLKKAKIDGKYIEITLSEGDIVEIAPNGKMIRRKFEPISYIYSNGWEHIYNEYEYLTDLCADFGINPDVLDLLIAYGYETEMIETLLYNEEILEQVMKEIAMAESTNCPIK